MLTVKLPLLAALALPLYGGFIIPTAQWGAGTGYADVDVPNYNGPTICYTGYSAGNPSCAISIASNQPINPLSPGVGSSYGSLSTSVDAKGAHMVESASGSGNSGEEVKADAGFGDTEVNNSSSAEQFQITFHLDAELYSLSSAVDQLSLIFYNIYAGNTIFSAVQNPGGAGTYDFIDQDITTPMITIAAHSSKSWSVDMNGIVDVSSYPNTTYLAGLPQGFLDAGNTLSMTQFSVFDMAGNALPQSALTSMDGIDYTSDANAPEPASIWLAGAGVVWGLLQKRKR